MKTLISLVAALMTCGCVHTADIVNALAHDTNSIRLNISTIYGTITLERNLPYKVVAIP